MQAGRIDRGTGNTAVALGDGGDAVARGGPTGSQDSTKAMLAAAGMEVQQRQADSGASAGSGESSVTHFHPPRDDDRVRFCGG